MTSKRHSDRLWTTSARPDPTGRLMRGHAHRLDSVTTAAVGAPGSPRRYLHSLWLLSARDLRVRYATSALGYLWSVLDPLVMSLIYWFVFTQVFQRTRRPRAVHRLPHHRAAAVGVVQRRGLGLHAGVQQGRAPGALHRDPPLDLGQPHRAEQGHRVPLLAPGARAVRDHRRRAGRLGPAVVPRRRAPADGAAGRARPARRAAVRAVHRPGAHHEADPPRRCSTRRRSSTASAICPASFRELAAFNPLSGIFTLYRDGILPRSRGTRSASWSARS